MKVAFIFFEVNLLWIVPAVAGLSLSYFKLGDVLNHTLKVEIGNVILERL